MVDLAESTAADEAPAGYRMTELGLLPEDWGVEHLADVAEFSKKERGADITGSIPFIPMTLLPESGLYVDHWEDRAREEVRSGVYFRDGDLLLAKITPCLENGKQGIARGIPGGWGYATTEVYPIHGTAVLTEYLAYYLRHQPVRNHLVDRMEGSTGRQRLPKSVVENLPIPLPPLPEQRAIAHVLSTVQRAREATEAVIAATRELKRSLMRHLFLYGPVPVDQVAGVRLKETEIGLVPEGWEVQALGSVAVQTQYGLSVRGEKVGRYPILRMNSLQGGQILIDDLQYVDLDVQNAAKFMLRQGDVIFNRTNSFDLVGKTALFDLLGDYVFASYLVRLTVDRESVDPAWINQYLNWTPTQIRLKGLASRGVSQSNISASKLRTLPIPLPPLAEQEATTRRLCALDRKLEVDKRRLRSLDETLRTTLHNLMTGAMRVPW